MRKLQVSEANGNEAPSSHPRSTWDVPAVYVRHEALFVRMEVEDLDLPAVVAAG
jgi:hypothetical protein